MEMTYVYTKAPGEGLDRLTQLIMDEERVQHFERKEHDGAQVLYFEVLNNYKEPQDLFEHLLAEVPSARLYWQCMDWEYGYFRSNDTGHEFFKELYFVYYAWCDLEVTFFESKEAVFDYVLGECAVSVKSIKCARCHLAREGADLVKIEYRKKIQ